MKFLVCLFIAGAILVASDDYEVGHATTNLWKEGKVPYEISKQYTSDDTSLIKEALVEIMRTTCIKFLPRFGESDYSVFMEYKSPDQKRGTCWSGKWNNGASTVGNQNGRHIVSLWPDLDCFSKFGMIRELLYILGVSAKSSTLAKNHEYGGREILYEHLSYEEQWTEGVELSPLGASCRKADLFLKTHLYALDIQQWSLAAKEDSCSVVRNLIKINQLYNCPDYSADKNQLISSLMAATKLPLSVTSVSPDCKAEADAGTCESDPVYMSQVCEKSFCDSTTSTASTSTPLPSTASTTTPTTSTASTTTPSTSTASTTTPSTSTASTTTPTTSTASTTKPSTSTASTTSTSSTTTETTRKTSMMTTSMTSTTSAGPVSYLKNGYDKCLASPQNLANNLNPLSTSYCAAEKGMLWSYNETALASRDRHICNGHKKCVTIPQSSNRDVMSSYFQMDPLSSVQQMFVLPHIVNLPGFFIIRNVYTGECIATAGNRRANGDAVVPKQCNPNEAGQRWKWEHM